MLKYLNKENFNGIIEREKVVLVDFYADWCGPCQAIQPTLEELANELSGQVVIAKVNVDEERELAGVFNIRSIPTMILFKDGEPVEAIVGLQTKATILKKIKYQVNDNQEVTA